MSAIYKGGRGSAAPSWNFWIHNEKLNIAGIMCFDKRPKIANIKPVTFQLWYYRTCKCKLETSVMMYMMRNPGCEDLALCDCNVRLVHVYFTENFQHSSEVSRKNEWKFYEGLNFAIYCYSNALLVHSIDNNDFKNLYVKLLNSVRQKTKKKKEKKKKTQKKYTWSPRYWYMSIGQY